MQASTPRPARDPQAPTWRSVERKPFGMTAAGPGQLMRSAKPHFQNGHQNATCALKPNTAALWMLGCAFGRNTYWNSGWKFSPGATWMS